MIYLGHISISTADWLLPGSLRVRFQSAHDRLHQVYIGRRLAAQTTSLAEREIVLPYSPGSYPEELTIVAIDPEHSGEDLGHWLPPRPYNAVRARFSNAAWSGAEHETDVRLFELFAGSGPGEELDYEIARGKVLASGPRDYELSSGPLGPSGEWNIGIRGRDTREAGGNAGDAVEQTVILLSYPKDLTGDFAIELEDGVATIITKLPAEGLN